MLSCNGNEQNTEDQIHEQTEEEEALRCKESNDFTEDRDEAEASTYLLIRMFSSISHQNHH